MRIPPLISSIAGLLLAGLSAGLPLRAAEKRALPDEEARKIASAVPSKATVQPATTRRLLVFTLANGYYHQSIPDGAKAVELMGQRTGAFTPTVSDDPAMFEPETLRQFDGVCLVNALGEFFLPDDLAQKPAAEQETIRARDRRLKENLLQYVRSGKGLAAIHGGCYAFHPWSGFAELIGATFDAHPWNGHERVAVKVDEPGHPVVAAFGGHSFEIIDEGYQFKDPYSRKHLRVLLSMDVSRMDLHKSNLRPDHDFGLAWVKRYGEGRVFYCALGHNPEEYWNPALLQHYLDGIQFSLGDLPAETTPRQE